MIGSGNSLAITLLEILRRKTPVIESLYWTSFPTPKPVSTSTISASMSKHPEPRTVLSVKPARHQLRLRRWQAGPRQKSIELLNYKWTSLIHSRASWM